MGPTIGIADANPVLSSVVRHTFDELERKDCGSEGTSLPMFAAFCY